MLVIVVGITPLLFFTATVLAVGVHWVAWQPLVLWNSRFGAGNGNGATAVAFNNSDLFVAGYLNLTAGAFHYSTNPIWYGSTFLTKYDSTGQTIWTRTISNNFSSIQIYPPIPVSGIAVWTNSVYLATNTNASSLLMRYDASGNRLWISRFGGPYSEIDGLSAGPTGVYSIGSFDNSTRLFQAHNYSGNLAWSIVLNDSIAVNDGPLGLYVLTTGYLESFDTNGKCSGSNPSSAR